MKKQTAALLICLLCLFFAFSSLSSIHLIARGHSHVCTGIDCQICSLIDVVEKFMDIFALVAVALLFINPSIESTVYSAVSSAFNFGHTTPITLKVKLSD